MLDTSFILTIIVNTLTNLGLLHFGLTHVETKEDENLGIERDIQDKINSTYLLNDILMSMITSY